MQRNGGYNKINHDYYVKKMLKKWHYTFIPRRKVSNDALDANCCTSKIEWRTARKCPKIVFSVLGLASKSRTCFDFQRNRVQNGKELNVKHHTVQHSVRIQLKSRSGRHSTSLLGQRDVKQYADAWRRSTASWSSERCKTIDVSNAKQPYSPVSKIIHYRHYVQDDPSRK